VTFSARVCGVAVANARRAGEERGGRGKPIFGVAAQHLVLKPGQVPRHTRDVDGRWTGVLSFVLCIRSGLENLYKTKLLISGVISSHRSESPHPPSLAALTSKYPDSANTAEAGDL
jgi:hypothetical protein